jgi:NAD(P)-dependent dehydrogenase (short-subunit alcohol dehydrogenase family)
MKVVLADVEAAPLAAAEAELGAGGASVLAVLTDVTSGAAVAALAERAVTHFGAVHVVCNNAGVAAPPARCGRSPRPTGRGRWGSTSGA